MRGGEGEGEVGRDRDVLRDREQWGRTGRGGEGQQAVGRDRERCGGTGRGVEGQGAVGRGREEWGGIVGTFLPSPFLHSVSGACVLVYGGS